MEKRLKTSLQAAVAFLEKHGFRYAVIGGIALSQWGVVRVTRDVDIKVLVPDTQYDSINSLLHKNFPDKARPDIEALLIEQHGKLDDKYIENWLSQFADALEYPEVIAKYKRLTKKIQKLS